jgi:hypothetical protein
MAEQEPFTLAINYWPRQRQGSVQIPCSWTYADVGAVRAELAHIADLGYNRVDFTLRWAEAQPGPQRLQMTALRHLERALDAAADLRLAASIALLEGSFAGALHLPIWAIGYRLSGDLLRARRFGPVALPQTHELPAILTDDRYRQEPVGDLFTNGELHQAQIYLLREVIGGLGQHPAAAQWQLGSGITRVRRPTTSAEVTTWWEMLVSEARRWQARQVLGSVEFGDLVRSAGLRPKSIVQREAHVAVRVSPLPQIGEQATNAVDRVRFVHALVAGLIATETGTAQAVHVRDLGVPTAAEGQTGWVNTDLLGRRDTLFLADYEQQARFVEASLDGLYADGARGVTLLAYADQPAAQWDVPPLDRSWLGRTGGIVDALGREKPAAEVVRRWADRLRVGALSAPQGTPTLPLDPERYWHKPEAGFMHLAADFLQQS